MARTWGFLKKFCGWLDIRRWGNIDSKEEKIVLKYGKAHVRAKNQFWWRKINIIGYFYLFIYFLLNMIWFDSIFKSL